MSAGQSYSILNGFENFNIETACKELKAEQQRLALERRRRLKRLLKAILEQRTEEHETCPRDLVSWRQRIIDELDSLYRDPPTVDAREDFERNAGWNYYYDENWYKIEEYFKGLYKAGKKQVPLLKTSSRGGITSKYEVKTIIKELRLSSPRDGRKSEYDYLSRCIQKLLVPSLDQTSDEMTYLTKAWSAPISKKVKEKANQFNDVGTWLSIEAVMRYVRQKLVQDKAGTFANTQDIVWFLHRYEKSKVLIYMGFEWVLPSSETLPRRWTRRIGRTFCFTSKSLSHRSRIGIRQVRMRGITLSQMEEAKDGGYYF